MTTASAHRELGLTDAEYDGIVEQLGREPNALELAVFSLMWSEHCAYKHSKKLLRTLPTEGPHVLMGPGENAGVVDVGDGLAVAFKVESHNHPSAVEPFQGAATGVGGILRDVFAVGARPIAVLDSLRFGELSSARSRYLFDGAVQGIGHYGNSIGVPTVGGEVLFEGPYEQNCLVNAMCLGIAPAERLIKSAAAGVGNQLVLLGARTGRDGIGGASVLASAELGADDADKRPTVQIGDPFEESRLLECCLELLEGGTLRSLQDLGAAGLSSSSSEMASKGEVGLDIDVARVPVREDDMEPFEIMISESQERMLCVVEPGRLSELMEVCGRWEVRATPIGEVTDTKRLRVFDGGELVGDMPVGALVDDVPLYDLEPEAPSEPLYPDPPAILDEAATLSDCLLALLGSPNVASKRFVFEQYDSLVGSRTVRRPQAAGRGGADAGARRRQRRAGGVDRRQRQARGLRPVHGRRRGRARVRAQPRLRRRRAARPDQLPELRQPREAAHRLAAHARGRGHARRLPGAGCARGGRQRVALQRGRRGADLPDAGGGDGREAARPRASARHRLRRGGPRDRARGAVRAVARRLGAREAERPAVERAARGRPRGPGRGARLAAGGAARGRDSHGARHRRGRARGGAGRVLHRERPGRARGRDGASVRDAEALLFGEGPGGVVLAGPREALERLQGATVIGEVAGDLLEFASPAGSLRIEVERAREVYERAIPDLMS